MINSTQFLFDFHPQTAIYHKQLTVESSFGLTTWWSEREKERERFDIKSCHQNFKQQLQQLTFATLAFIWSNVEGVERDVQKKTHRRHGRNPSGEYPLLCNHSAMSPSYDSSVHPFFITSKWLLTPDAHPSLLFFETKWMQDSKLWCKSFWWVL